MFQLIAQRRIGRFMLADFMKSSTRLTRSEPQTEIGYRTIGKDFHYGEEKDAVFCLGSWMRALEACFQGGTYSLLKLNNILERRKRGCLCHAQ